MSEVQENTPAQFKSLSLLVHERPEALATGDEHLRAAALAAAKYAFDLGASR